MKRLSTLILALLLLNTAFAQIPNPGFETWTMASGYVTPTGWDNPNANTISFGFITCDSGMAGAPEGAAYLRLRTVDTIGITIPGVAVTGVINIAPPATTYTVTGGFPVSTRPANLTGKWQHEAQGADHGRIVVVLWEFNAGVRDTVAIGDSTLTGSATAWADFSIPLTYSSGATPDSAIIVISSSASSTSATDSSYLYADDLAFSGTVPSGVISVVMPNAASALFPNPATGTATLYYHSTTGREITVQICDMMGRVINTNKEWAIAGENNFTLNLAKLAQGIYYVKVIDSEGIRESKLMVE